MRKELLMYTIICDRCGRDACSGSEHSAWDSPEAVMEMACDGWIHEGEKDYCHECVEWNEDWSRLEPRPPISFDFQEQDMSHLRGALKNIAFGSKNVLPELTFRTNERIPTGRYDFRIGDLQFHRARLELAGYYDSDPSLMYRCGSYDVILEDQ